MQGSFLRHGMQARRDPGTRPGLHGQTLISTGLPDLDALLEGGLTLGSVILLLEDPHSQQHHSFIKYFLSEGVACGQKLKWLIPREPPGGVAAFLPSQQAASSAAQSSKNGDDDNEDGSDDDKQAETELRIAWQYRKYIKDKQQQQQQQEQQQQQRRRSSSSSGSTSTSSSRSTGQAAKPGVRTGATRAWAHSFDLRRGLGEEALQRSGLVVSTCPGTERWDRITEEACSFISEFALPESAGPIPVVPVSMLVKGPAGVGRLVVQSLGGPAWRCPSHSLEALQTALLRCVLSVRQAARDTRCAVMISCPAGALSPSTQMRLQHMCDTVLMLQSISDTSDVVRLLPDPTSAAALLAVRKLPEAGMAVPRLSDPNLYVIRHKRKSIGIQMVDIDPDAEAAMEQNALAAGGTGKPASATLCAGPPQAKNPLDF